MVSIRQIEGIMRILRQDSEKSNRNAIKNWLNFEGIAEVRLTVVLMRTHLRRTQKIYQGSQVLQACNVFDTTVWRQLYRGI